MDFLPIAFGDGVVGGFFGRRAGVSGPPFASLNVSYGVGDDPCLVAENRRRLKERLGLTQLLSAQQVHDDRILSITKPGDGDCEYAGYDALITNQPGLGLLIQQADCQAVVLYDPVNRVVANVHSGWRGSVANIIAKTVERMRADFGADPAVMWAAISPSLGPCCAEFVHFQEELPREFHQDQVRPAHFDFWAISRRQLQEAGLSYELIHTTAVCTRCDPNYFSYRREGRTGRSATVIALRR
ncbi:MAG: peptidoglycan editing factor PgeF [Desulfobulbaceae bacterium]|nr:peptidoglycan editing factor PgeF [Desulfobulbaceae bacterium]